MIICISGFLMGPSWLLELSCARFWHWPQQPHRQKRDNPMSYHKNYSGYPSCRNPCNYLTICSIAHSADSFQFW